MNRKMREILAKIQEKTNEAKNMEDVEKASAIMDEVDELQRAYDTEKRIYEAEKMSGGQSVTEPVADPIQTEPKKKEVTDEEMIAKQVRAIMNPTKYGADKILNETTDEDGGYTVPDDVRTQVNHWPEAEVSFLAEISEENVSTNKGSRTYQTKADVEAFIDLDENGSITKEITAPQFERISYTIKDRAGFMPVSNDLVSDSDANIMNVVTDWLGRANVATANSKIMEIIKAHKNPKGSGKYETTAGITEIKDGIDGIKKIINVILGQAYKSNAKIITNDDGLQYLDTLKDANGRPLLNPDPTDSAKLQLRCGTTVVPVSVKPNKGFESNGAKVPFIIGDLKAGIRKYNRQSMSLKASDVAVIGSFNAFAMNMTLIRAILRDDYKELDKDAYYYGCIDTAPTVSASN